MHLVIPSLNIYNRSESDKIRDKMKIMIGTIMYNRSIRRLLMVHLFLKTVKEFLKLGKELC